MSSSARRARASSFVTGDAVNVADRLQKAAEPGEVLAGERTAAAVAGAFALSGPRTVDAKGKPGGVVAFSVERALRTMRPRGVGGLRRVFVGRDSELELLRATYRRAASQSDPHLVTIVGEPGVGKVPSCARAVGRPRDGGPGSGRVARGGALPTAQGSPTGRSARSSVSTSTSARVLPPRRSPRASRIARFSLSLSGSTSPRTFIRPTRGSGCTWRRLPSSRSSLQVARPSWSSRTSTGLSLIYSTFSSASSPTCAPP